MAVAIGRRRQRGSIIAPDATCLGPSNAAPRELAARETSAEEYVIRVYGWPEPGREQGG